jgi:hypothetical protein
VGITYAWTRLYASVLTGSLVSKTKKHWIKKCLGEGQAITSWVLIRTWRKLPVAGSIYLVDPLKDHSSTLGLALPSNLIVSMVRSHLPSISNKTLLRKLSPSSVKIVCNCWNCCVHWGWTGVGGWKVA